MSAALSLCLRRCLPPSEYISQLSRRAEGKLAANISSLRPCLFVADCSGAAEVLEDEMETRVVRLANADLVMRGRTAERMPD